MPSKIILNPDINLCLKNLPGRSYIAWTCGSERLRYNVWICTQRFLSVQDIVQYTLIHFWLVVCSFVNHFWLQMSIFLILLRGGADTSIAWPTSQCRRTESIVSLERGARSCAELQVLSCYRGWKEACQATRAISTTLRRELSSSFFSLQGKAPNETHAILTETLEEHATVKNWVAQLKRGDFSTCDAPRPGRHKTVTTP